MVTEDFSTHTHLSIQTYGFLGESPSKISKQFSPSDTHFHINVTLLTSGVQKSHQTDSNSGDAAQLTSSRRSSAYRN